MSGKIFVTGDCHGDYKKFNTSNFPEQKGLDKDDYVVVCGDFGLVWNAHEESKEEKYWMEWLEDKPYTTLFVDGNHENFDRLYEYPVREWHGGKVHEIRPSILHLMRGQVFDLSGKTLFTFGGAASHDSDGGILSTEDPDFHTKKKFLDREYIPYRIEHYSWWKEELPSEDEYEEAIKNLKSHGNAVDYIITHCCDSDLQAQIGEDKYAANKLTDFFSEVKSCCEYKKWFFGHYHKDEWLNEKDCLVYKEILPL